MSLNGRKVKIVRIHGTVHFNGLGQLGGAGGAIDINSAKLLNAMVITRVDGGVVLKTKTVEGFIPDGNIVSLEFLPEDTK